MTKKRRKTILIVSIAAVVAAGGGVIGITALARSKSAESVTTFQKAAAKTGTISTSISGSGSVSDSEQFTLTAASAGTVESVSVQQGGTVKKGQVIAKLGDTGSEETVQQKQDQLTSAQNDLAQAKEGLNDLTVRAPVAGRVKSITASSGDSLSTIKPLGDLAVISTSRSMSISFHSSRELSVGDAVTVVDGGTNVSYAGKITSVSGSSNTGGQSGSAGGQQGGAAASSGSVTAVISSDSPGVGNAATVKYKGAAVGTGEFALVKSVSISNSGSGSVSAVYVKENQTVSKNQSLFRLSGGSAEQQVSAKQEAVEQAQSALKEAQEAAAQDTVTSPADGVVAQLSVKAGDKVASGASLAVIINPDALQTVVSVDELDISKVKVGQKAETTLDAVSGKTFSGAVTQIDPIGSNSNGVATYSVTVSIENPEGIRIGMTSNTNIITESKENVVVVSAEAVLNKSGNKGYVLPAGSLFDSSGKSVQLKNVSTRELIEQYGQEVTIGLSTEDSCEITEGVQADEELAVPFTVNSRAIASLSNSQSENTRGFGGMGGTFGGPGGGTAGGMGGNFGGRNRSGGTGNTVAGGNGTNGGTASGSTGNNTGNNGAENNGAAGGDAGNGGTGNNAAAGGNAGTGR